MKRKPQKDLQDIDNHLGKQMRDSPKNELMFWKALGTDGGRKRDKDRQSETIRVKIVSDVNPRIFSDQIMEETKWRGERHDEERLRRGVW